MAVQKQWQLSVKESVLHNDMQLYVTVTYMLACCQGKRRALWLHYCSQARGIPFQHHTRCSTAYQAPRCSSTHTCQRAAPPAACL